MKKNIISSFITIILLGLFNTLYKYIMVSEIASQYNFNTNTLSSFVIKSKVDAPYLKIFILSILSIIFIYSLILVFIHFINKISYKEIFMKIFDFSFFSIFIILSCIMLFINKILAIVLLIIGLVIYFKKIKLNDYKTYIILFIFWSILIYLLYYISS